MLMALRRRPMSLVFIAGAIHAATGQPPALPLSFAVLSSRPAVRPDQHCLPHLTMADKASFTLCRRVDDGSLGKSICQHIAERRLGKEGFDDQGNNRCLVGRFLKPRLASPLRCRPASRQRGFGENSIPGKPSASPNMIFELASRRASPTTISFSSSAPR